MKERLIQTSSIFYNPDNLDVKDEHLLEPSLLDIQELQKQEDFVPCRQLHFGQSHNVARISLKEFFPDSMFCILYDVHLEASFIANMSTEIIFEVPFEYYCVEVVAQDLIIISMDTELGEGDKRQYMVLEGKDYRILDNVEYEIEGKEIIFEGIKHSLETSEIKPPVEGEEAKTVYFYETGTILHIPSQVLYFEAIASRKQILLADNNGSYLGYYLALNPDGSINLRGRSYRMLQRLTLTLAIVLDLEEEEAYILSCVNQTLMALRDFFEGEFTDIEVINGVAMLIEEDENGGQVLNVFTPNHQRIVLEPGYKVNAKAFGNGLYFEKDDVLLLENGSLIFTERLDKRTVLVRGKEVQIPVPYLGEV